ncbi:MAG: hypothetical protein ACRDSK_00285 [Actinophytocola sp.]|uniref:hypothetical protein n=1 Tax=Actinophytocola sp. TaxID=1872138 RepID=UPI003D6C2CF8
MDHDNGVRFDTRVEKAVRELVRAHFQVGVGDPLISLDNRDVVGSGYGTRGEQFVDVRLPSDVHITPLVLEHG